MSAEEFHERKEQPPIEVEDGLQWHLLAFGRISRNTAAGNLDLSPQCSQFNDFVRTLMASDLQLETAGKDADGSDRPAVVFGITSSAEGTEHHVIMYRPSAVEAVELKEFMAAIGGGTSLQIRDRLTDRLICTSDYASANAGLEEKQARELGRKILRDSRGPQINPDTI